MDSDLGKAIRERLSQARRAAGLTQKQAGERLSKPVSAQSISKWELGRGSPNPRELTELATVYGVSLDWLGKGMASRPDTGSAVVDRLLSATPAPTPKPRLSLVKSDR